MLFPDRVYLLARDWSNHELRKFAHLFPGDVVNVSAWKDSDKHGGLYREYFPNARTYTLTNYKSEMCGFQGVDGELFLDLEADLPQDLRHHFDVVFNHTTLEHVYSMRKAFQNLCELSRDVVILVVPFLQRYHTEYGDYWRFTPPAITRLFAEFGFSVLYQTFNEHPVSSVYIFCIASRHPEQWRQHFNNRSGYDPAVQHVSESHIGWNAIRNYRFRAATALGDLCQNAQRSTRRLAKALLKLFGILR